MLAIHQRTARPMLCISTCMGYFFKPPSGCQNKGEGVMPLAACRSSGLNAPEVQMDSSPLSSSESSSSESESSSSSEDGGEPMDYDEVRGRLQQTAVCVVLRAWCLQ